MVDQALEAIPVGITTAQVIAALMKPFPQVALRQRTGAGNKSFTYVDGMTVVRRLTRATGNQWTSTVSGLQFIPAGKTAKGEDQVLVVATVELTIPGLGTRAHLGVQKMVVTGGEDLVKGAVTDGIKKAATLFGVAADLYGEDTEHIIEEEDSRQERMKVYLDSVEVVAQEQGMKAVGTMMAEARNEWMTDKDYQDGVRFYKQLRVKYGEKKEEAKE